LTRSSDHDKLIIVKQPTTLKCVVLTEEFST